LHRVGNVASCQSRARHSSHLASFVAYARSVPLTAQLDALNSACLPPSHRATARCNRYDEGGDYPVPETEGASRQPGSVSEDSWRAAEVERSGDFRRYSTPWNPLCVTDRRSGLSAALREHGW
jgi:hypothetical protein